MPAPVNLGGDDGIIPRRLLCYTRRKRSRDASTLLMRAEKKYQAEPCSMDVLTDECLQEILRRLPGLLERSSSACVSKRWLLVLSRIRPSELSGIEEETLKSVEKPLPHQNLAGVGEGIESTGWLSRCLVGREVSDVRVAAVAVGTAGRGGLSRLMIRGCPGEPPCTGLTHRGLYPVSRCCPSLRVFSLSEAPNITDAALAELASGCPMIEDIELCRCPLVTGKGFLAGAGKCPNLVSVMLESCASIGNEGLQAIGCGSPKLQSVFIKDCPLIGDQGINAMMCSASSSLAVLKLENLNVSDLALASIGHYGKAVTDLYLTGPRGIAAGRGFLRMGSAIVTSCRGVTAGLSAVAKGCPNLKKMRLRRWCCMSDTGLKAFVKHAHALEYLRLEECHRVTLDGVLEGLVVNCSAKMETLELVSCLGIKDPSLSRWGRYLRAMAPDGLPVCESLLALTITGCPGVTGANLAVVGRICPSLINLDLGDLVGLTNARLCRAVESTANGLVNVNLRGCANIADSAICALVKKNGEWLQVLDLGGCYTLTDSVLLEISEHCMVLKELDMSGADVTDQGVAYLASAWQLSVHDLSFASCVKVTPMSLPVFRNMGPTLVRLNLLGCCLICPDDISSLQKKMYWCRIIF